MQFIELIPKHAELDALQTYRAPATLPTTVFQITTALWNVCEELTERNFFSYLSYYCNENNNE